MRKVLIPAVTAALVVAAMLYQARTVDPVLCDAPDAKLAEIGGYTSEPVEVSEAERHVLPDDTGFDKRRYEDGDGNWFQVSMVIGGKSKSSIHRPELCLPGQGFQMMSPRTIECGGVEWHLVTLARGAVPACGFAYTFFNQDGYRTSSHLKRIFRDVWDRSIRGRIDRWVMVTVYSPDADEARLAAFLGKLKGVIQ